MDINVHAYVTSRLHNLFMVATEKSTATDDTFDQLFPDGPLMLVSVRTDLIPFLNVRRRGETCLLLYYLHSSTLCTLTKGHYPSCRNDINVSKSPRTLNTWTAQWKRMEAS